MTASRLPTGGTHIDRSTSIAFEFDGRTLTGFAGDTIASALLANGVDIVGRSIYHDRPRGIVSAGPEEPNALVQVRWPDGASEPMLPATTVMLQEGMAVSSLAGRGPPGPVGDGSDPGRFDSRHAHCEVLVIGAGESGRRAAAIAQVSNPEDRVLLIDADPVATGDGVRSGMTALGIYDHGYVTAVERRPTPTTEGRLWHIRARRSSSRPAPRNGRSSSPTTTVPGSCSRAQRDLRGAVWRPPGRPGGHLHEQRHDRCRGRGHPGRRRRARRDRRRTRGRPRRRHERRRRRAPDLGDDRARRRDARPWRPTCCSCPAAGTRTWRSGATPGARSGSMSRSRRSSRTSPVPKGGSRPSVPPPARSRASARSPRPGSCHHPGPRPSTPGRPTTSTPAATRPCATCSGRSAPASSRSSTSSATRRSAPASSRGALGGVVASAIAASILGQEVGAVGVPTFRPPTVPVSFAQLAARDRGPARRPRPDDPDPGVARRERRGLRGRRPVEAPALLPARRRVDGRGCAARVRRRPDRRGRDGRDDPRQDRHPGSGRRDLPGPDLTNMFSTLKVGSCRYGLMCRPDGMVFDDGVTSRLSETGST